MIKQQIADLKQRSLMIKQAPADIKQHFPEIKKTLRPETKGLLILKNIWLPFKRQHPHGKSTNH